MADFNGLRSLVGYIITGVITFLCTSSFWFFIGAQRLVGTEVRQHKMQEDVNRNSENIQRLETIIIDSLLYMKDGP